mmetsp:Transcript_88/g.171  ORF Transcript_88/g.171 Transcript_88/m.171 type:complete len:266 (+) Transcript_88:3971-4768(+)
MVLYLVDLGVLVVDLHLVEAEVAHASGVDDEPSLGDGADLLLNALLVVVVVDAALGGGEDGVGLADDLEGLELALLADGEEAPVVEAALPELAEVELDLDLEVVLAHNVPLLDLVPRKQVLVVPLDGRGRAQAHEDLEVLARLLVMLLHHHVHDEVLAHAPDDRAEGLLELPVHPVIEHVEEHDGAVPDPDVAVALQLNQQLLYPIEAVSVVSDLGHEERPLDLLHVLHLLDSLPLSELVGVLEVHLLVEGELLDVDDHLGESSR